jgi:hypothetical protein
MWHPRPSKQIPGYGKNSGAFGGQVDWKGKRYMKEMHILVGCGFMSV